MHLAGNFMSSAARRWLHHSGEEQTQDERGEHCNYRHIPPPKAPFATGLERHEVPGLRIGIPMFHDVYPFTAQEICRAGAKNVRRIVVAHVFPKATTESANKGFSICRG